MGAAVTPPETHRFFGRAYSRAEIVSDGVVHVAGLVLALVGLTVLLMLTLKARGAIEVSAVVIYGLALLTMLACSLAYNITPVSPRKWLLRRFDHCGIYLLIAGTYTPLLTQVSDPFTAWALGVTVWGGALGGIVMALGFPGRGERFKVAIYLALAWVAVLAAKPLLASLSLATVMLVALGGILYTVGVIFYRWDSLKYQNTIWHAFVVAAATCHFAAITHAMAFTP
jgi:hemolysin III